MLLNTANCSESLSVILVYTEPDELPHPGPLTTTPVLDDIFEMQDDRVGEAVMVEQPLPLKPGLQVHEPVRLEHEPGAQILLDDSQLPHTSAIERKK